VGGVSWALSVMMAAAAYGYQKLQAAPTAARMEDSSHETVLTWRGLAAPAARRGGGRGGGAGRRSPTGNGIKRVALGKPAAGAVYFRLPRATVPCFGKAPGRNLRDLRLYDAQRPGSRIWPCAFDAHETKQTTLAGQAVQPGPDGRTAPPSCGWTSAPIHRSTTPSRSTSPGQNVRRRVRVEGSDQDGDWATACSTTLFSCVTKRTASGSTCNRFRYPVSRFRYLRLTLEPDAAVADDAPGGSRRRRLFHSVQIPGEELILPANLSPREPTPGDGGPGLGVADRFSAATCPLSSS